MHLYPTFKRTPQSFAGVKKVTVPMQSMTLREIIQRFIRKESLPIEKEGMYEDRMGDLEKLSREDITVQHDRAADLKDKIKKAEDRMKKKAEEEEAKKAPPLPSPPVSGPPVIPSPPLP